MPPPLPYFKKGNLYNGLFFVLLAAFAWYAIHIAALLPLQSWDESHNLLSAYEMQKTGDYIGITYRGELDHWDIKPPLFTWLAAFSFRVFGFSEWAARLPSIGFGLGSLAMFYFFFISITRNHLLGILCSAGLALSIGFFGQHGLTTGDYDIFVSFFVLLSFIAIYKIIFEKRQRWLYVLAAALGLGFMTKSVAGLIPLGFLLVAIILHRGLGFRVKFKIVLLSIALLYLITIPYFLVRESIYHEGYLSLLFTVDIYRKLTQVVEAHQGGWLYYFEQLNIVFKEWIILFYAAVSLFVFWMIKGRKQQHIHQNILLYTLSAFAIYLIIFTLARTKACWYLSPVYPIIVLFTGLCFHEVFKAKLQWIIAGFLLLAVGYEGRNLMLYNQNLHDRDFEFMTKNLILPNKEMLRNKTVLSADTLLPSAITYIEILTDGKHYMHSTIEGLNQHLEAQKDFDYVLVSDTTKLKEKDDLTLVSSAGVMGLYQLDKN